MTIVKSLSSDFKAKALMSFSVRDLFISVTSAFAGAALIAFSAQVSLPLPMTPIPLSLTAQVVCWLAWNFPMIAPGAVTIYLLSAGLKLPVLAMGSGGWLVLLGPRAGYLVGYFIATLAISYFRCSSWHRRLWRSALLAQWMGSLLILIVGTVRLAALLGLQKALNLGFIPFLIGDLIIKAPLFAALTPNKSRN